MRFFRKIIDRIFCVIAVIIFCQLPLFITQYEVMLHGHFFESKRHVDSIESSAIMGNKTIQEYIEKFIANEDSDFSRQGVFMQELYSRHKSLHNSFEKLHRASLWKRPMVFLATMQFDVVEATWQQFVPGIVTSLETLCYALLGLFIAVMISNGLSGIISLIRRKKNFA